MNDVTIFQYVVFGLAAIIYFLPAMNARGRRHQNTSAIFVLNLFLGWTLIGWVAALVWSFTAVQRTERIQLSPVEKPTSRVRQQRENMRNVKGILIDPFACTVTHDGDDYVNIDS